MALSSTLIFSLILLLIPIAKSSRCSKNFTFDGWQLNSPIPSNLDLLSNTSNNHTFQDCRVHLTIDLTTGLVNGWFNALKQSFQPRNQLDIVTVFSLNGTSKNISITYVCSVSDYCDVDFLRETLSSAWSIVQMESIQAKLAARFYNSNTTDPIRCSNNNSCPQDTSFCSVTYSHTNGTSSGVENVESGCNNRTGYEPIFVWLQTYTPLLKDKLTEIGVLYCNVPDCASNKTVIDTFQWLNHEYILPLNISVLRFATTTTTWTTGSTTTTTTKNHASHFFGKLNIVILCFLIILFFH